MFADLLVHEDFFLAQDLILGASLIIDQSEVTVSPLAKSASSGHNPFFR